MYCIAVHTGMYDVPCTMYIVELLVQCTCTRYDVHRLALVHRSTIGMYGVESAGRRIVALAGKGGVHTGSR